MDQPTPDAEATEELLRQARTGDEAARQELLARHRAYLCRFVELRLDPQLRPRLDPSDVVQDAQLEAVRRLPDYLREPGLPFRLWLRQIAYDRLLMAHRRHVQAGRRAVGRDVALPDRSSVLLVRQLLAGGPSPSEQLSRQELARRVRQALAQLPAADRELLMMRNFEGLSSPEVAQVLGITPAAVRQRYGRTVLRLRKLLLATGLPESQP
jgi:RNA polymerase sigma-70 factor (ECF subfamily)